MNHSYLSEKYQKWLIKYQSDNFNNPIYFIWLTDTSAKNHVDKCLVNADNQIIVSYYKKGLLTAISKLEIDFPDSKKTKKWLAKSLKKKRLSATKYNFKNLESKILANKLKPQNLNKIVNFINLSDDYEYQIGINKKNLVSRTKRLTKLWDYYYDHIFFPNFYWKKGLKKYKSKPLKINNQKLVRDFTCMQKAFESRFLFVK